MRNITTKLQDISLVNIRTFDNIRTLDNRKIKSNRLFRSNCLVDCTSKDIELLKTKYNLKTIIDLRNEVEANQRKDPIIDGVEYILNPILTTRHMSMTHEKECDYTQSKINFVNSVIFEKKEDGIKHMTSTYLRFVNDQECLNGYHNFLKKCIDQEKGGILFHCSVGKDRAGTAAFLLLKLLNVDNEDILEDYLFTNTCVEDSVKKDFNQIKDKINYKDSEKVYKNLYTCRKEYILALIDQINLKYGDFHNFVINGLKLSDDDILKLQNNYLESL